MIMKLRNHKIEVVFFYCFEFVFSAGSMMFKGIFKYSKTIGIKRNAINIKENLSSSINVEKYGHSKKKRKIDSISSAIINRV